MGTKESIAGRIFFTFERDEMRIEGERRERERESVKTGTSPEWVHGSNSTPQNDTSSIPF